MSAPSVSSHPEAFPRDWWVRPSTPEDGPAIVALMREAGLLPNADPAYLYWKYWQERADWPGSRSFVLSDGRDLLAHLAVVPVSWVSDSGPMRLASMVDWAARPCSVGGGVRLMKHVSSLTDGLLGIGGSPTARRVMALTGFQLRGLVTSYVRPLSPFMLLREKSIPGWKRVPRFARSVLWATMAPRADRGPWQVRRVPGGEVDRIGAALSHGACGEFVERSLAQVRYVLDCPTVPMRFYALERAGRISGYFLLAITSGQARIVDARVGSKAREDWVAMLNCAAREANKCDNVVELAAWSSNPLLSTALQDSGFHSRFTVPIFVRSGRQGPAIREPLQVQMLDSDEAYLDEGRTILWA